MPTASPVRSALVFTCFVAAVAVHAQPCSFSLGDDTLICAGTSVQLDAPAGASSVLWSDGTTGNNIVVDATGTYWCQATLSQGGPNLVVNGDFTQGTLGFTSDLTPGGGGVNGPLTNEGTYGVSADPATLNNTFTACSDHTGGDGPMLVVNGGSTAGLSPWCTTVNVQPNTDYTFSAWIASLSTTDPAQLVFSFNGTAAAEVLQASSVTCDWRSFFTLWNSGTSTSVTICITDTNTDAGGGNDYALDDISFAARCTYRDSIQVTELPASAQVIVTQEGGLCPGDTAFLHAALDPAVWPADAVDFLWNTQATDSVVRISSAGGYSVSATGPCLSAQGSIVVPQDTCWSILTMPNVFTPNGDGVNDTFGPIVTGTPTDYVMEIYNRWGAVVYRSVLIGDRWTGRATGIPAPEGTYFWTVRYTGSTLEGVVEQRNEAGYVTLRR